MDLSDFRMRYFQIEDDVLVKYTGYDDEVEVPDGVKKIGDNAFAHKYSIVKLTLPDSLESIGSWAFSGTDITSIVIPDGVEEIGSYAFFNCSELLGISLPGSVKEMGFNVFESCEKLTIYCPRNSFAHQYAIDWEIPVSFDEMNTDSIDRYETFEHDGVSYRRFNDIISVNESTLCVNDEWTFELPFGCLFETDAEYDCGIRGAIDPMGSVKPMVIKGYKQDDGHYIINAQLQEPAKGTFLGQNIDNHRTVFECRHDERVASGQGEQKIYLDDDDFYLDLIVLNFWPIGVDVSIRVRGEEIKPVDIKMMVTGFDETDLEIVMDNFKEIAESIERLD